MLAWVSGIACGAPRFVVGLLFALSQTGMHGWQQDMERAIGSQGVSDCRWEQKNSADCVPRSETDVSPQAEQLAFGRRGKCRASPRRRERAFACGVEADVSRSGTDVFPLVGQIVSDWQVETTAHQREQFTHIDQHPA